MVAAGYPPLGIREHSLELVVHGRATLGATHWGAELYAGWDVMLVNEIPIHGPIAGFRYWF